MKVLGCEDYRIKGFTRSKPEPKVLDQRGDQEHSTTICSLTGMWLINAMRKVTPTSYELAYLAYFIYETTNQS